MITSTLWSRMYCFCSIYFKMCFCIKKTKTKQTQSLIIGLIKTVSTNKILGFMSDLFSNTNPPTRFRTNLRELNLKIKFRKRIAVLALLSSVMAYGVRTCEITLRELFMSLFMSVQESDRRIVILTCVILN